MITLSTRKKIDEAYDTHADDLFRYCYYRIFDREKAKDLVKQVFVAFAQEEEPWSASENEVKHSLYRKAHQLTEKALRIPRPATYVHTSSQGQEMKVIDMAYLLKSLKPEQQPIAVLQYINNLPTKEISTILDSSEHDISVAMYCLSEELASATKKIYEKTEYEPQRSII